MLQLRKRFFFSSFDNLKLNFYINVMLIAGLNIGVHDLSLLLWQVFLSLVPLADFIKVARHLTTTCMTKDVHQLPAQPPT